MTFRQISLEAAALSVLGTEEEACHPFFLTRTVGALEELGPKTDAVNL